MSDKTERKCDRAGCGCEGQAKPGPSAAGLNLGRRDFLRLVGASSLGALAFRPWEVAMAGPFTRADFDALVPADKKLSPEWVKSLFVRGEPERYTKARGELRYIGMPVGGVCAGQLYLGGDGKLWHWDLFNVRLRTGAEHYAKPMHPASPLDQGFALRIIAEGQTQERPLDAAHWSEVSFLGEYPIGYVDYADAQCPVSVRLEAFSPFIPLNVEDSSLPATVLEFTLKNAGATQVEGELAGWLENAVGITSGKRRGGVRKNGVVREAGFTFLECSAEDEAPGTPSERPDIVFEDFESETYGNWSVTGTAFGKGPVELANVPHYQGDLGGKGKRAVNSHASAPGNDDREKDFATGKLVSRPFTIERAYITFLIGGGNFPGKTCMNLLVDDKVVLSATGAQNNRMKPMTWDVQSWAGHTAQIAIVDEESGSWGNIGVDEIVFTDRPVGSAIPLASEEDYGSMGLALLGTQAGDLCNAELPTDGVPGGIFSTPAQEGQVATKRFGHKLAGSLCRKFVLAPGASVKVTFVLAWFFPNLHINRLPPRRFYGTRFDSAKAVAAFVAGNYDRLASGTRLWHDTWYDSSLPHWFLDRTFLNTSTLATSTCYRLGNGRFYSWEGVGCCEGTCGHVWHYAQAMARVFPQLERNVREMVDFGLGLQPDGAIHFRGEFNNIPAVDAQAGTILRALREHEMSADATFLKRNWPRIKKATEWLIAKDGNGDGLIEGNQHNTLDTDWYGPVAWLSGLYLAALVAAETLALEMEDREFAARCRQLFTVGQKNLVTQLYDNDYFMNKVEARHLNAINSGTGCEIDQVMGQSWAFQVGLPRVLPEKETISALKSLWRYNFTPDVGPYRAVYKPGRWYAMPGEAGLLMCTFPRTDWDYTQAKGKGSEWAAGYFNECMNGFEYQVAGHMLWEGLVMEGLAVTRAVHDRYHPARRNPWNEVECGDHYVRSMASYGVFLAACGFEYHGPRGHVGFAPRLTPEKFQAAFIGAEGWGTFRQTLENGRLKAEISVRSGKLKLSTIAVEAPGGQTAAVSLGTQALAAQAKREGKRVLLTLSRSVEIEAGEALVVSIT